MPRPPAPPPLPSPLTPQQQQAVTASPLAEVARLLNRLGDEYDRIEAEKEARSANTSAEDKSHA